MKMKNILFFISVLLAVSCSEGFTKNLQVVVLDVGMGQSLLLVEDGHGLLVDTGLSEYAPYVLSRLKAYEVDTLDYLILSHLHPDHAGGYSQIKAAWPKTQVFASCNIPQELHPTERDSFINLSKALEKDPLHNCLAAGAVLHWREHLLQVLWPELLSGKNLNYDSIVLLFTAKQGGKLLIMSDVDKEVEQSLQAALEASLDGKGVDIYVAAHHAAADSTDPGFLKTVHPEFSTVSVGKRNPMGYPSEKSMAVLEKQSEVVLRTDRDGEICFEMLLEKVVPCTILK
jgi:competence protein ComEC